MIRILATSVFSILLAASLAAQQAPPVWKWEYPQITATVNKVRAGRDLTPKSWPNGARVAVPRILKMLETHRVPASFFIPAVSGQLHPDAVDAILKSPLRHEIGVHGWVHERLTDLSPEEERRLTRRALDFWTERLGHKPIGIRTPSWDFTGETLALIRELGFL